MKLLSTLLFLFFSLSISAQKLNLRKAILKSDFIFSSGDYTSDTVRVNDFTSISYVKIKKTDSILKNKFSAIPQNLTLRQYQDNEDFFSPLITNGGGCVMRGKDPNNLITYYNIFFARKTGKEHQAFLILSGLEWSTYKSCIKQITTIATIEKIKNEKERFEKTLDWFIDNGILPDFDFVEYYKKKGVCNDKILYSELQYQNALKSFERGNEELLPVIKEKYFEEIKNYYVKKMQTILDKDDPEYSDYYEFSNVVLNITDYFREDPTSGDYILNDSLTSDKFDEYDKKNIMRHLLQVVNEWK